jgi:hypothetical protein
VLFKIHTRSPRRKGKFQLSAALSRELGRARQKFIVHGGRAIFLPLGDNGGDFEGNSQSLTRKAGYSVESEHRESGEDFLARFPSQPADLTHLAALSLLEAAAAAGKKVKREEGDEVRMLKSV